jgi:RHS repeat-associated protein
MDVLPTGGGTVRLLGTAGIDTFNRGNKFFELSNHLGNVLVTVSDRKLGQSPVNNLYTSFTADVVSATDYAPFGMQMVGRTFDAAGSTAYRYGFNGKENDPESSGDGNQYDYGFRIYNSRLGRFLSVDPLTKEYPWYTPYQFAGNKPIISIDLDGLEEKIIIASSVSRTKPSTQTQSAISIVDQMTARTNAINGIVSRLFLEELRNPKEPPSVIEYGTMVELTVSEKREIIESTVRQFTICISTSNEITPTVNPNFVAETYTVAFDFNYNLLGNKEKIDDIKSSVKAATTVIEYASKVREVTGRLPKILEKMSGPSSIVSNAIDGDGLGVSTEVGKMLIEKGLVELAKKAPSLAPVLGIAKSNPVTLTIQFTFQNSAPPNRSLEIKEKRIEALKIKIIGALLFLFENNNKRYTNSKDGPNSNSPNPSDHPEDVKWKKMLNLK